MGEQLLAQEYIKLGTELKEREADRDIANNTIATMKNKLQTCREELQKLVGKNQQSRGFVCGDKMLIVKLFGENSDRLEITILIKDAVTGVFE